ncbi:MAG: LysR family transcriptional regulator [Ruminococcus sp.]|nr:LysR family transcriptional regulator [Ruminococcus sp.]
MLDMRLVYYFLVVAREQNITRAAAELHISQPTLSSQIASLEKRLGKKLFIRTNKSTLLTEDGILFRSRASELIEHMNKVENEITISEGEVSGDIYFGAVETNIMDYISSVFKEIKLEHPDIRFHLYSGNAQAILEKLEKGLLDIGLMLGSDNQDKYNYFSLGRYDKWGILVPADCETAQKETLKPDEIASLPLIIPQNYMMLQRKMFTPDIKKQNIAGTFDLISNAAYLVEKGIGYALGFENMINTEGRNLKFVPIVTDLRTEHYIVTKKYAYFSKAAKLLLKKLAVL